MNGSVPSAVRPGGSQPHIVIAYGYADHEFARKLAGALRRDGVSPWVDEVDMSVGVILTNRIAFSVRPVDFIVPLISEASAGAGWVQHELKTIITRENKKRPVRVLPARIDTTAMPEHLKSTYLDFHGHGWQRAYEDLRFLIQPGAAPRPVTVPIRAVRPPTPIRRPQSAGPKRVEKKIIYASYDYVNDTYYKDILLTWAQSPDFPHIQVNEQPITTAIDGPEAEVAKRMTAAKIGAATGFLCVVGPKTNENPWIEWEIKTAIELDRRMVVVRVNRDCVAPDVLSEVGPTCALSFTFEGIKQAVDEAYGTVADE